MNSGKALVLQFDRNTTYIFLVTFREYNSFTNLINRSSVPVKTFKIRIKNYFSILNACEKKTKI